MPLSPQPQGPAVHLQRGRRIVLSNSRMALALFVLSAFVLGTPTGAQASGPHCTLRHRIPGKARREIMRKCEAERPATAGGIRGRKAWIRCGLKLIAVAPIVPPPK